MGFNKNLENLDYEENIAFALSCIFRQRHLPQLFINSKTWGIEEINKIFPKNKIKDKLDEIIDKVKLKQTNEIDADLDILKKFLLDFDDENSIEYSLFFNYVCTIIYLLEYLKDNNIEKINYLKNLIIESVDVIEECGSEIVDKKMASILKEFIDAEKEREVEITRLIKNKDYEKLHEFVYNKKYLK